MKDNHKVWLAGIIGTVLFSLMMDLAPILRAPHLNVALWDGSFITLNLKIALIVGYGLQFLIGVGLAALYRRYWAQGSTNPALKGLLFGVATWVVFMAIGLPIFDRISPLVQNGLMLGPGPFLWRMGLTASLTWLIASLLFGSTVGYIIQEPANVISH